MFFSAFILPILIFLQKKTTFIGQLKSLQQVLVSICVIFNFFIFFLFFKVRNEDYLHGSNKHLDLHCAKICITSKRILRKQAGFNRKHSTTLISFAQESQSKANCGGGIESIKIDRRIPNISLLRN